jgi:hypothetical protein
VTTLSARNIDRVAESVLVNICYRVWDYAPMHVCDGVSNSVCDNVLVRVSDQDGDGGLADVGDRVGDRVYNGVLNGVSERVSDRQTSASGFSPWFSPKGLLRIQGRSRFSNYR